MGYFVLSCPTTTLYGTARGIFQDQLSQNNTLRDSKRRISSSVVPKQHFTGQQEGYFRISCPKTTLYGTARGVFRAQLSQNNTLRDSKRDISGSAVPKQHFTGQQKAYFKLSCPKTTLYGTARGVFSGQLEPSRQLDRMFL